MNYYLQDGGVVKLGGKGGHPYDLEIVIVEVGNSDVSTPPHRESSRSHYPRCIVSVFPRVIFHYGSDPLVKEHVCTEAQAE